MRNLLKRIGTLFHRESLQIKQIKILSGKSTINLTVQVADTLKKRAKGLMFVEKLPANEGMLFVFPEKTAEGFWMKNTLIPLSIALLDTDGRILNIVDMEPCKADECPIYDPEVTYDYALEVNLGWFKQNQIKIGDYVKID